MVLAHSSLPPRVEYWGYKCVLKDKSHLYFYKAKAAVREMQDSL